MTPNIINILQEVNADPQLLPTKYKDNAALAYLFEHAFLPSKKFLLPEGTPPFKPDTAPLGMTPGNFYQQVRKLYVFCREDLRPVRREQLFVQFLESLHPSEAEILIAVKDQRLTEMYPGITADLVRKFGIPVPEAKATQEQPFRAEVVEAEPAAKHIVVSLADTTKTTERFGQLPPAETAEPVKRRPGRPRKTQ